MTSSRFIATVRIAAISTVAFSLTSCELPPREAWSAIQSKGLLTYYMNKDGSTSTHASRNVASSTITTPKTTIPSTPPPSQISPSSLPVAKSVPDLPGYVRTPFTNPPRLVDVRGMSAGSKVVCPYTQKPFLVAEWELPLGAQTSLPIPRLDQRSPCRRTNPHPRSRPQRRSRSRSPRLRRLRLLRT